jgi:hypothetical protein
MRASRALVRASAVLILLCGRIVAWIPTSQGPFFRPPEVELSYLEVPGLSAPD